MGGSNPKFLSTFMRRFFGKGRIVSDSGSCDTKIGENSIVDEESPTMSYDMCISDHTAPRGSHNQARGAPLDVVEEGMKSQPMDTKIEGPNTDKVFLSEFTLGEEIGKGSYSIVHLVTHNVTGEIFACKVRIVAVV